MATSSTYNYETELSDLDRRQKLMEAMSQGAMGPMQTFQSGGRTGKISPFQMLNQVLSQYMAGQGMNKVKQEKADLSQRYSDDLVSGMQKFQQTEGGGAPVDNFVMQPDASGTPQTVPALPDRKKAIFDAMASNHPVLKEMGMKLMMAKPEATGQLTPKDLAAYASPESVLRNPADPSGWAPKRDIRSADGGFFQLGENGAELVPGGPTAGDPIQWPGVGLVQASNTTGKLDVVNKTPTTNITSNINASPVIKGQKAGMEAYFKSAANKVEALGNIATTAQDNLNSIAELKNLNAKGIYSNVTSGPATFLANLGQVAGVSVDTAKLANTENYNSITTDLWQGLVAKYGGNRGVTKDEAMEIKKLLPLAAQSPQAREQLFTVLENVGGRQIQQYQQANDAFARASLQDDPTIFSKEFGNIFVPSPGRTQPALPPPGAGAPAQVIKWEDLK